ncbi:MAG: ferredoxin--NADP+ reductase [Verrucomicrobiales bacterium]|jgi:ferredoxin--NADP+ reductase
MSYTLFHDRPLRIAIVGAGPAGFYAAEELLKGAFEVRVDLFERLFAPYGLVRYGVAPDHPKTKLVTKRFNKVASDERVRFLGGIEIGTDLTVEQLRDAYDAVVFTTGAESGGKLNIPGESLPHCHHAVEFVGWYNGHPDYAARQFDLSGDTAVIIGNGNVAIDLARILAKPTEALAPTDIARHALDALAASKIKNIIVLGRRGPAQASFTQAELKELHDIAWMDPSELVLNELSQIELNESTLSKKIYDLFAGFPSQPPEGRSITFRWLRSPVEITSSSIRVVINELHGASAAQKAVATEQTEDIPCGLVLKSSGYFGHAQAGLPFDERRGVIPNQDGRVEGCPGVYVAGWIKRGPSGLIGHNKMCAANTVASLIEDLPSLKPGTGDVLDVAKAISWSDWLKIAEQEATQGYKQIHR